MQTTIICRRIYSNESNVQRTVSMANLIWRHFLAHTCTNAGYV